ncbi:MAG: hypothetical protein ABIN58_11585, partial [candidate division WOR-3 bacterium]
GDGEERPNMINKLIVAFMVIFFIGAILSFFCDGRGGLQSTRLASDVTASDTIIIVDSTAGFDPVGTIVIDGEKIHYRGKTPVAFLACQRGYDETTATNHSVNKKVMTEDSSAINSAVGFNITGVSSGAGIFAFPVIAAQFIYHTLPKLITFDFSFLEGDGFVYFRWFMMLFSVGFVFAIFYIIFTAVGSVGSTLFSKYTS